MADNKYPKVTIAVPTYNGKEYLRETVESLLNQNYQNFEILIVDNCSDDGTEEMIHELQRMHGKTLIYSKNEKNLGPCGNWNRCLEMATGKYITIFHADDIYEKNIISKEVEFLERYENCVAVFTAADLISSTGKNIGERERPTRFKSDIITHKDLLYFCIDEGYEPLICPTFMARIDIIKKCGFFDCKNFRYAFDMDYYFRLFEWGNIGFLKDKLIRYRQHILQGSFVFNNVRNTQTEFFMIVKLEIAKIGMKLEKTKMKKLETYEKWGKIADALEYARAGKTREAMELTKQSLKFNDALISFPSLKIIARTAFVIAFLTAQKLKLGKYFSSTVFWYRIRKRA